MESTCWSCGEGAVVSDPDSGALVCTSCGRVHDAGAAEFVHQAAFTEEGHPDLRCASKWSLTTGRHPLPLVAGLVAFAAEVNGVTSVSLEDIAQDISAGLHTSLRRYKELVDVLVRVSRELLPWGADVNAKNLLPNAPVLLRLMEMRSQSDPSERFLESFAPDIAGIVQVYSSVDEDESKYLQIVPLGVDDSDSKNSGKEGKELENLKISEGCLSDAYQNVLKEARPATKTWGGW